MTAPPAFDFVTSGRIQFGWRRAEDLTAVVNALGQRVFVVTGSSPLRYAGVIDGIESLVGTASTDGEPSVESVRDVLHDARRCAPEVIVAVGGGSVIDTAKAVAMLYSNGGDPLDYIEVVGEGRRIARPSVPLVAVPTTAGTGAEVTMNAVLSAQQQGVKASLRSPFMLPTVALVDPKLTVACPPSITAASGLDALTQCLEPFVSRQATVVSDMFAKEGLRLAARSVRRAYENGEDRRARTDMSLASLFGGLALANAKLGAVHGFAGAIGGLTGAPHGEICAALLPAVVEINTQALRDRAPEHPAGQRYREVAQIVTGDSSASVGDGIAWLRSTTQLLCVRSLREIGLAHDAMPAMATAAAVSSSMRGNPIELKQSELLAALALAM